MRVLVTGGAGYIGSVCVQALLRAGHTPLVYDNLSEGHREAVRGAELVVADLRDRDTLVGVLRRFEPEAVMHFAASALVAESVENPRKYYENNVGSSLSLLGAMLECGVRRIVFSSTAATYGVPQQVPIPEDHPQQPINPYGFTKLVIERAIRDYAGAYGIGGVILRYFNAAGASNDGTLGEDHQHETHLIPLVLQVALGQREHVKIYGTDYPTPDGTCVRDFVHVEDLADVHVRALDRCVPGEVLALNVGTGQGHSVREVIEVARQVTGHPIPAVEAPRRPGDPPILVAAVDRARRELAWEARFSGLRRIIESAWEWHRTHPHGHGSADE